MNRNLLVIGAVAVFGLAAAIAGAGDAVNAVACDDAAKSAAASSSSCCAKGAGTTSASAKNIHGNMIKSAMVAPGAGSAAINVASLAAMSGHGDADCDWCPEEMCATATEAAAKGCPAYKTANAACGGSASAAAIHTASTSGTVSCDKTASAAAAAGCEKDASAAAAAGCEKDAHATAASSAGCCAKGVKTASAEGGEHCTEAKSASLKGVVDELPYRESKRVVVAGSYACSHCTLHKTETCAPMLKTTDGKVYPLLKNSHIAAIKGTKGGNIEVSGVVKKIDGVKYIDVKSYKVI